MLRQDVLTEIDEFLSRVRDMTVSDFEVVDRAVLEAHATRKSTRPLLKLGAADSSWLLKRVRDVVGPMMGPLGLGSAGLAAGSIYMVFSALRAIVRRDRLSQEQYEAFVGGFRGIGFAVPPWRGVDDG